MYQALVLLGFGILLRGEMKVPEVITFTDRMAFAMVSILIVVFLCCVASKSSPFFVMYRIFIDIGKYSAPFYTFQTRWALKYNRVRGDCKRQERRC